MKKLLRYVVPDEDNEEGCRYITVTKEEAIRWATEAGRRWKGENYTVSDKDALLDFIAEHWAWEVDNDKA